MQAGRAARGAEDRPGLVCAEGRGVSGLPDKKREVCRSQEETERKVTEMIDVEQVIAELQYMKRDVLEDSDKDITLNKAIALLKEQETVKPNGTRKAMSFAFNGMLTGYCPRCGTIVNSVGNSGACGKCGQKFDWE